LHNFSVNTSNRSIVSVMNVSCHLGIKTECSKCLPAAATQNQRLRSFFRNDWIALSVNSCGKSFHIGNKAVFSSAMLVGFGMCSIPVSHPHDNPMYGDVNVSEVIFKSESQFNYLSTLQNVH